MFGLTNSQSTNMGTYKVPGTLLSTEDTKEVLDSFRFQGTHILMETHAHSWIAEGESQNMCCMRNRTKIALKRSHHWHF